MSKRNRRKFQLGQAQNTNFSSPTPQRSSSAHDQHAAEYKIINRDLLRLLVVNAIFLAGVLGLYYADRKNNILEQLYTKIF